MRVMTAKDSNLCSPAATARNDHRLSRTDQRVWRIPCVRRVQYKEHAAMKICVQTILGQAGQEVPRAFYLAGQRLLVAGIIDCWHDHPHRYFQLFADDGRRFLLRHDLRAGAWELAAVYGAARPAGKAVPA